MSIFPCLHSPHLVPLDDLAYLILHHGRLPLFHPESSGCHESACREVFQVIGAGFEVHFYDC